MFCHLLLLLPGHKMMCVGQAYRYISKRTLPLVTRIANRSLMNSSKVSKSSSIWDVLYLCLQTGMNMNIMSTTKKGKLFSSSIQYGIDQQPANEPDQHV